MTFTWHWFIKETHKQEELARMVSDLSINHVVTGLTPSDGGSGVLNIAAGYGRNEGWRVVTAGEAFDMSGFANDTYYVYILQAYDGNGKVDDETITAYTSVQTDTNRIYLAEVEILAGVINTLTDRRKLYAFTADQMLISGSVTLDEWRHTSDLTKIDGADIYDKSFPTDSVGWAAVDKTGSSLAHLVTRDHGALTGLGDHDHSIYARHGSTVTVSEVWTHTNTLEMKTALEFFENSTRRGRIVAYSGEFRIWSDNATIMFQSLSGGDQLIKVECATSRIGGLLPTTHEKGMIGNKAIGDWAWFEIVGKYLIDDDGTLGSYSEREDLSDLRKIKELRHPDTGKLIRGSWGDPIIDAASIPYYIRSKAAWDADVKRAKKKKKKHDGRSYINNSKWKGWMISLHKRHDEENVRQDEEIKLALSEIYTLRERINILELALAMLQP